MKADDTKENRALETWRRQLCKVLPKHWVADFPVQRGRYLYWKIHPIDFDMDTELSFEHLRRIGEVLNTEHINIKQEAGTQGYSEWTPGSDANIYIEARTEAK